MAGPKDPKEPSLPQKMQHQCVGFVWKGLGGGGATGVTFVGRH